MAVTSDGVERRYDTPVGADDESRLIDWQFPVRVLEGSDGRLKIVNRAELEARRDKWLKAAKLTKAECGSWYFNWNAFKVECDLDAILETVKALKIQPTSLANGAIFSHPAALNPARLQSTVDEAETFSVELRLDPDYVHRSDAASDVVVGELMREPITFDAAYSTREKEQVAGSVEVVLKANAQGRVVKQNTTIKSLKISPNGDRENSVSTTVIERERT